MYFFSKILLLSVGVIETNIQSLQEEFIRKRKNIMFLDQIQMKLHILFGEIMLTKKSEILL